MDRILEQKRNAIWKKLENESRILKIPTLPNLENVVKDNLNKPFAGPKPFIIRWVASSPIYLNNNGAPEQLRLYGVTTWNLNNYMRKIAYQRYTTPDSGFELPIKTRCYMLLRPEGLSEIELDKETEQHLDQIHELLLLMKEEPSLKRYQA